MTDIFNPGKRSDIMRLAELRLIEIFKQNGINGWRRNYPVKGHPDFVFLKEKIAVFVDGCFWHGHDCPNTRPADHNEYWQKKRERNIKHDQEITEIFVTRGWTVLRIWESELKRKNIDVLQKRFQEVYGLTVYNKRR